MIADIAQQAGNVAAVEIDPDARIPVCYYPQHTSFITIIFNITLIIIIFILSVLFGFILYVIS